MKKRLPILVAALALWSIPALAQFAAQVPLPGNEGIAATSTLFKEWASGCTLYRGWLDIADKSQGQPSMGSESDIYGAPHGLVLSLGDSGVAVVTFPHAIMNGPGPDFAVFENGFANPENDSMAFLELAFVEVSSDGQNFFRFPATSLMQNTTQIDNFTYSNAIYYNNLAGKYKTGYGTPFDLEELKSTPGLDVNHITHVRIVDVVGSIDPQYASRDKDGRIINDPYPSVFASGGFDLQGVGVINSDQPSSGIDPVAAGWQLKLYPNPASDVLLLEARSDERLQYQLTDVSGRPLRQGAFERQTRVSLAGLCAGLYFMQLDNGREHAVAKIRKQ
ncbi:T9SS type A sorting domain-containing protein [Taibaiella koreensis]|uniref:T9SS type A sorting domain-containing protein n=1 Tax=Taibaiella koreensis TaxID=1268548 RepID=UPI000E59AA1D|nr:T9SS type A sorting domain-containing protein [Taibaiella koreensis]